MLPAARVTDKTLCDHGDGTISPPCGVSVKAGKQPAARFSDRSRCADEPDTIREGARTVLIGGLPASRSTDGTFHGGIVTGGLGSVKIGGPKITGRQESSTFIAFDPEAGRMFVVSYLEYHGSGASQAYADAAKKQIEGTWSRPTTIHGKPVDVVVRVNTSVNPTGTPTPGYDRICVVTGPIRSNQALNGGEGTQGVKDAFGPRLSAAHEYGHTLGIPDQYMDTPTGTVPDPSKTKNLEHNNMATSRPDPRGALPHPYPEHYETILERVGLP